MHEMLSSYEYVLQIAPFHLMHMKTGVHMKYDDHSCSNVCKEIKI